jgi:C-terminal peptidase prc
MSRDKIVEIDGESTEGIDIYDAVDKMRGKIGTDCILTIKRKGVNKLLTFTITRSLIDLPSLEYYYMLTGEIGYIRLVRFSEDTGYKMLNALNELEDEGMKGLVLDLRGNPGGLLQMAIDVSSIFLKDGEKVVYTKGRYKFYDQKEYYSFGGVRVDDKIIKSEYYDLPLVILVDGSSASASEIVAGAIQDNDRGLVIGQPTFGKASVQTVIKLDEKLTDTSALKMTIAKYYTPSGNLIENEGIKPDVEIEYPEYSPVINSIAGNGFFRVFAEDFAYNHKDNSISLFRDMSEFEFLRNIKEILAENDYEFYSEEVAKILPNEGEDFVWSEIDAEYQICRKLVERELIRLVEGNEESFRFWQKDDIWIERAISELSEIIQK